MNPMSRLNMPDLIKSAVPEAEGRNVRITGQNESNHRDAGFLSKDFPRGPPKLYITAEEDNFDELTLAEWRSEGFDVEYFSMESCTDGYVEKLRWLSKEKMAPCEKFGIVAYGDAAAECLEHYHVLDNNPEFKLGLLIAYYPTAIPDPQGRFPNSISALVHLAAGEEIGVTTQSQMVGIQGKRRTTQKKIQSGAGTGGTLRLAYPTYTYNAEPGFAEHDMDEFDRVSAELAWSRSLSCARKAFGSEPDLEAVLDVNTQSKFFDKNPDQAVAAFTTHKTPHITNIPTLTGGIGAEELKQFYSDFFVNPPSTKVTLLSRTIGADRIVDELHVQFKHTQEVPWILPGVPATDKKVEIAIVSIVTLRGGKLYHEHVYWDQASVLVQVGLIDPKLLPDSAKELGVKRLPVVGRRAARRLLKGWDEVEVGEADNKLILVSRGKKKDQEEKEE
ncbi:dienelactone hydrolase [Paramyrothecium foliicola]|nr:dienelactone hydrolase [Paramyrothecium foliicola]